MYAFIPCSGMDWLNVAPKVWISLIKVEILGFFVDLKKFDGKIENFKIL